MIGGLGNIGRENGLKLREMFIEIKWRGSGVKKREAIFVQEKENDCPFRPIWIFFRFKGESFFRRSGRARRVQQFQFCCVNFFPKNGWMWVVGWLSNSSERWTNQSAVLTGALAGRTLRLTSSMGDLSEDRTDQSDVLTGALAGRRAYI